ncbi:hypothetical protein B0T24DRAFT_516926 [Lasiosphaeria ovina]|uniref:Threonine/serine exporter-like N-terminal domain-containing protein n=1 Tax=Lasiosphaeria ovina TaxID=92902 RepID=A0AAE0NJD5_9PEZI|nr:hypothetical protein B0T24DRAFT_516926 [Lasiosphaeria ovina]
MASPSSAGYSPAGNGSDERQEHQEQHVAPPQRQGEDGQPQKSKEKKKVGFANESHSQPGDTTSAAPQVTPGDSQLEGLDYFSMSPGHDRSSGSTPLESEGPAKRESFNRAEITAALEKILHPHRSGSPVPPSKPRPVLRKPAAIDSPTDQVLASHPSEVEAKDRADRLAFAVGTSSIPGSRRTSRSDDDSPFDADALLGEPESRVTGTESQDFAIHAESAGLRPRKRPQEAANDLVRSHTRSYKGSHTCRVTPFAHPPPRPSPIFAPGSGDRSGTATPIPDDQEYIPRPHSYKGGILGNLLKLYNTDEKNGGLGNESTGASTPSLTPNQTPSSTPPTSRPGTPRGRPGLGSRSFSGSTLAGLMESSFIFAAPASNDISGVVSNKLKQEKERTRKQSKSRQNLKEFRITKHIAEIISRHQYLMKLCYALMMYGAPTHRLEAYMTMSARVLGIEGQFLYLPGTMIISFDDSNTHTTEVKIVRAPGGLDLGRLRDVHEIYKQVVHDLMGVDEATTKLKEVMGRQQKFAVWFRILIFGLASAFVAPFGFEGRYVDMPICFILGCMVGFLQLRLAPTNELYANVFEITAAVLTSFLSRVFGSIQGGSIFCFSALAQSSIALILPGYLVLCASLELQSHQIISGSVRMVYALIYSLFLGYGITIGSVIYGYIDENAVSDVHCSTREEWYYQRPGQNYYLLFVLPFTLCLCVINQSKWKQTPVMVFISLAGYCVSSFSARHFKGTSTLSSSLGALCIGVMANLYSRCGRYVQNQMLDIWERYIEPRAHLFTGKKKRRANFYSVTTDSDDLDVEMGREKTNSSTTPLTKYVRRVGYGLAAAAMLPAIFVQVPSGLAVGGSLLSGVTSADQITRNETLLANGTVINGSYTTTETTDLNSTSFNVLFSVIQVAIGISVGLSLSALIIYPFGKRRSGLFSF